MERLPVIDVSGLVAGDPDGTALAARQIDAACRDVGFFYVVGHGIDPGALHRLDQAARAFFDLPDDEKARIAMPLGGRAWRGWFPLDGELTSGVADRKEGIYFGQELGTDHPAVLAETPLHGPNLFPACPAELRPAVLDHIVAVTALGHSLLRGISVGLGLDADWFARHLTADPLVLFRCFRYPPDVGADRWSVGEHTDYGLLTILAQDDCGGLEVRSPDGWVAAPPIADSFVVNLGDMLERMTGGAYRSTPHRVRNAGDRDRLAFPLFLDPAWDAEVLPVPLASGDDGDDGGSDAGGRDGQPTADEVDRWDGRSPHDWTGTYGEYLLSKVGRVFPELRAEVLDPSS